MSLHTPPLEKKDVYQNRGWEGSVLGIYKYTYNPQNEIRQVPVGYSINITNKTTLQLVVLTILYTNTCGMDREPNIIVIIRH